MKLSTKIKKYLPEKIDGNKTTEPIVFLVDLITQDDVKTNSLIKADEAHNYYTKQLGYTLLPLNECPFSNGKEIVLHYTSSTYKEWCNLWIDKYFTKW